MRFIIDTQLPPKLAKYLKTKGYDSLHTTHFENGHLLKDHAIIEIAKSENRIVITKDSDFSDYYFLKGAPPKVLLLKFGNISNKNLINNFELYFDGLTSALKENAYVIFGVSGISVG